MPSGASNRPDLIHSAWIMTWFRRLPRRETRTIVKLLYGVARKRYQGSKSQIRDEHATSSRKQEGVTIFGSMAHCRSIAQSETVKSLRDRQLATGGQSGAPYRIHPVWALRTEYKRRGSADSRSVRPHSCGTCTSVEPTLAL